MEENATKAWGSKARRKNTEKRHLPNILFLHITINARNTLLKCLKCLIKFRKFRRYLKFDGRFCSVSKVMEAVSAEEEPKICLFRQPLSPVRVFSLSLPVFVAPPKPISNVTFIILLSSALSIVTFCCIHLIRSFFPHNDFALHALFTFPNSGTVFINPASVISTYV